MRCPEKAVMKNKGPYIITRPHRAIHLVENEYNKFYNKKELLDRSCIISFSFLQNHIVALLQNISSGVISQRLLAASKRAHKFAAHYGVKYITNAEIIAEILCDNTLVRYNESFYSRNIIHKKIVELKNKKKKIRLCLPLFSRKPVSPLKNNGSRVDLAEIASLVRCYTLAKMVSSIYDYGVEFIIYADGNKYQRACQTPKELIQVYQKDLEFWTKVLNIDDFVKIIDYEVELKNKFSSYEVELREQLYKNTFLNLKDEFFNKLDPNITDQSLQDIKKISDDGELIGNVFNSMLSTKYYLSGSLGDRIVSRSETAEMEYLYLLRHIKKSDNIFLPTSDYLNELCLEAWEAAIRYVAISKTDRSLRVWDTLNTDGIKLTIHAKDGEIQFRPTSASFFSMTAQHCSGGVKTTERNNSATYAYRLAREGRGDIPVMLNTNSIKENSYSESSNYLNYSMQPIFYIETNEKTDPCLILKRGINIYE